MRSNLWLDLDVGSFRRKHIPKLFRTIERSANVHDMNKIFSIAAIRDHFQLLHEEVSAIGQYEKILYASETTELRKFLSFRLVLLKMPYNTFLQTGQANYS